MERDKLRQQSQIILKMLESNGDMIRQQVPHMADMTDDEIEESAIRMARLADSPHPLGFWDSHGRVKQ